MLAPAYDLLALGYWDSLSNKMAMAIGGERRPAWLQTRHWQRFCEATGLNATQLRRHAVELGRAAMREYARILDELEAPPKLRQHISATLAQRAGWIEQRMISAPGGA